MPPKKLKVPVELKEEEREAPMDPKPKKTTRPTAKKVKAPQEAAKEVAPTTVGALPEGQVAVEGQGQAPPLTVTPPSLEAPEKKQSSIRFCPKCDYYLYLDSTAVEENTLVRLCRNCGHRDVDTEGGLVMEMMSQAQSAESYQILLNEFTRQDPRLPHIHGTLKCPDPGCPSNKNGGGESDIIYMKYDPVNLLYLYICNVCTFQWKSRR
jgi:DNA-directed RNA polymerase subunit M/transcription elongation factor TFIIS